MELGPIPPWLQERADPATHFARGLQIGAQMGAEKARQAIAAQEAQLDALRIGSSAIQSERELALRRQQVEAEQAERERMYAAQSEYGNLISGGTPAIDALLKVGPRLGPGAGQFLSGAIEARGALPPVPMTIKTARGPFETYRDPQSNRLLMQPPDEMFLAPPPGGEGGAATPILDPEGNPIGAHVWTDAYGRQHIVQNPWERQGGLTAAEQRNYSAEIQRIARDQNAIRNNPDYQLYQRLKVAGDETQKEVNQKIIKVGQDFDRQLERLDEEWRNLLMGLNPAGVGSRTNAPAGNTVPSAAGGQWKSGITSIKVN